MSTKFQHLTANDYTAFLYPVAPVGADAALPGPVLCFSGGGSRALSCALGQLSALNSLGILKQIPYISSVSGGSWASVLYTFLPQTINGKPVTDADFLIQPVAPSTLVKGNPGVSSPNNMCYMGPFCLGTVPQQFNTTNIGNLLRTLYNWGFFGDSSRWRWFWIAGVGEIVLKPFGLYDAIYNPNTPYIQPQTMFSSSAQHVYSLITRLNPSLTPANFYLARDGRPNLIVNTNILQNYRQSGSPQIPVQAMPVSCGVPGQSPDQSIQGGGGVESFGFTSILNGPGSSPKSAAFTLPRWYSLCDIAGCSSAFFAEYLLGYTNQAIGKIIDDLEAYLISIGWTKWEAELLGFLIEAAAEAFLNTEESNVIPLYNYWTFGSVSNPNNQTYGFSDGGDFDNTGVLGALARTNANRLAAFVNTEVAMTGAPPNVMVDSSLPLLFGYQVVNNQYVSFGGMSPSQPMSYVQVFNDVNPLYPHGAFRALIDGLYNASCGGGPNPGAFPATFLQKGLVTVDNPVANIAAGRRIDVLWFYNNRVNTWQAAIKDQNLIADLAAGQSQNPSGPLAFFPNYPTVLIELGVEAVNMLAQLSAYCVQQSTNTLTDLLKEC